VQTSNLLVRKRIATLFFLFTLGFFLLGGRVFWLQFIQGAELSEKALQNRTRERTLEAKRGIIYDRNGNELAISISADSIYVVPAEVKQSKKEVEIAHQLADILEMDELKVHERITKNSDWEWVKRQIDPEKSAKIRKLDLPGIGILEENRRYYPKKTLACHILGIAGIDNTGLEGIDFFYNDLIGGTPGQLIIEHDGVNRPIPEATHQYIPPVEGSNLILTLDETIQYITERELDKVFKERKAKRAAAIVMDPKTGEILAMTSRDNYDPNHYNDYPDANRRNFAINDAFEPGSTMKITTSAMALEEKTVNANSTFYCPGHIKVGRETITCANSKAHGSQTFAQIVENSCNVGFVQVGLALGMDKYYHYLNAFGFGKKTGIDLPGEANGILVPQKRAMQVDLASMAMGQANAVTAIQLTTAVAAVANEGKLMKPHLVKEITDKDGKVIKKFEPKVVNRVVSPQTAKELCHILEGEVTNGTGKNAYIEGYRSAGKTGTAEKIKAGGGYMKDEYIASFVGFAPADDPELVCIVVVDAPQGYPYYGGWVAAPAFKAIMEDSLRYRGVALRDEPENEQKQPVMQVVVPDVINLPLAEAISTLNARGLNAKVSGNGDIVWQQTPIARSKLNRGSQVIIYLSPFESNGEQTEVTVPDLRGKPMKEVVRILSDLGLHLIPSGSGLAYEQSLEPGKVITSGSTIKVKFQPIGE